MATANTILKRMSAVSGLGFKGEPMTLHGYLTASTTVETGDVLIAASGALLAAGNDPAPAATFGVLCALAATPPALGAQVPNRRVTNSAVADRTKYDDDKSVVFWPHIPGQIFAGHLITSQTSFTDERAEAVLIYNTTFGIATDAANGINELYVFKSAGGSFNTGYRGLSFVNPQLTTVDAAGNLIQRPDSVVLSSTVGTINPIITAHPALGALF